MEIVKFEVSHLDISWNYFMQLQRLIGTWIKLKKVTRTWNLFTQVTVLLLNPHGVEVFSVRGESYTSNATSPSRFDRACGTNFDQVQRLRFFLSGGWHMPNYACTYSLELLHFSLEWWKGQSQCQQILHDPPCTVCSCSHVPERNTLMSQFSIFFPYPICFAH